MSIRSRFTVVALAPALAAASLTLASPVAHATLIDEAEVQVAYFGANGAPAGFEDLTLIGDGAFVTLNPPAAATTARIANDLFPLSDAPVEVVKTSTGTAATTRASTVVGDSAPGQFFVISLVDTTTTHEAEYQIFIDYIAPSGP